MFRRSLRFWVILSIVVGASARRRCPSRGISSRGGRPSSGWVWRRQWFAVIPLVETERLLRISRTQDLIFAQTSYARLHTFDAETGRLLWSANLGERSGFARGVTANSWAVFVTNANMLFGLDRGTGREIWRLNLGTIPTSTPACDDSRVMVGMSNGMIDRPSPEVPRSEGERAYLRQAAAPLELARGDRDPHPAAAGRSLVAFGGGESKVWVTMADEPTVCSASPPGDRSARDWRLRHSHPARPLRGQDPLRRRSVPGATSSGPSPRGRRSPRSRWSPGRMSTSINTAGDLSSLDPKTGAVRWTIPTQGGRLESVTPTKIYLRSLQSRPVRRRSCDRPDGGRPVGVHLRVGLNLREYDLDIVNRFNDRMYFATRSGLILAPRDRTGAAAVRCETRSSHRSATSRRRGSP